MPHRLHHAPHWWQTKIHVPAPSHTRSRSFPPVEGPGGVISLWIQRMHTWSWPASGAGAAMPESDRNRFLSVMAGVFRAFPLRRWEWLAKSRPMRIRIRRRLEKNLAPYSLINCNSLVCPGRLPRAVAAQMAGTIARPRREGDDLAPRDHRRLRDCILMLRLLFREKFHQPGTA
jgi:hypothetical protein